MVTAEFIQFVRHPRLDILDYINSNAPPKVASQVLPDPILSICPTTGESISDNETTMGD